MSDTANRIFNEELEEMFNHNPPQTKQGDFDEFWELSLGIASSVPLQAKRELVDFPSPYVTVYDISYFGFDDTEIKGWYLVPNFPGSSDKKYPCIVSYHGFPGRGTFPASYSQWVLMGCAVVVIDLRDQSGRTGNNADYSSGHRMNVLTKGILDKQEYYLRALYCDCVKAIDFAQAQDEVDSEKIIIEGGSQGGGLGMAVCGLDNRPILGLFDVPSNSNLEMRVKEEQGAFASVAEYLRIHPGHFEKAMETLSYFDTMNMADKIRCRIFSSVGLKDPICPPQWFFASYNKIQTEKEVKVYYFNGHDGGHGYHNQLKLEYLMNELKRIKE